MPDGLSIITQNEDSTSKVREYNHYHFMQGLGMNANDDIVTAPTNDDNIQLRITNDGVLYYWNGSSWEIVSLGAIIAESINIGNTNLSLSSGRRLNGNGFSLLIDNTPTLEIDTVNLILKGGVFTLRTSDNPYFIFRIANGNGIDLDFSLLTAPRNLKTPDADGIIATESFVQENINSMAVFPLLSDTDGIISDDSLIGKKIGIIIGASVIYEEGFQFIKETNSDTILDAVTEEPFIFLPDQKYFLTPILP
jgi:hypothetical protein